MTEAIDTMFQDAVEALRRGDKAAAKDILTRLLKADQNNVTYWIWMSAAVESTKERVYCLQTALKLDPENGTAKRGLVLLGALQPDETIQPFSLNRPRAWEEKLLLAHELPKETGVSAVLSNPLTRLAGVGVLVLVIGAVAAFVWLSPRNKTFNTGPTRTPGPSPTFTSTPTFFNSTAQPTMPTSVLPTTFASLFGADYTATPLSVLTPRASISQDLERAAKAAYEAGDWDAYIRTMNEIERNEPDAADVPFYIGEAYRFKGDCLDAIEAYNVSLKNDPNFAPAYLGLARARLCLEPGADVTAFFKQAIGADPNYADTYLERANYYIRQKDPTSALSDLDIAVQRLPNNALVQLAYAQAYLLQGNNVKALSAAQQANNIDVGLLPAYFYLGKAYVLNQQYSDAIKPLETYLKYQNTTEAEPYVLLGEAYLQTGDYQSAQQAFNRALNLDPTQRQVYVSLGQADLRLGNLDDAATNFKKAVQYFPDLFDASLGLSQVAYQRGQFGTATQQANTAFSKATDDTQKALAIYWRALSEAGGGNVKDALKDFQLLLSMPESAMTSEMRQDAQNQIDKLATPTATPTFTLTPKPGKTTSTPTPTGTPVPTKTP
jgi:tetratricopeptide (TPR) repeat protein